MQGSCSLLLQFLTEVIREKEIVHIALVAQSILIVRADWRVKMILDLCRLLDNPCSI